MPYDDDDPTTRIPEQSWAEPTGWDNFLVVRGVDYKPLAGIVALLLIVGVIFASYVWSQNGIGGVPEPVPCVSAPCHPTHS